MFHVIVNLCDGVRELFSPPWMQFVWDLRNFYSVMNFPDSSLSSHSCIVGSSSRMWMVLSADSSTLASLFSISFFFPAFVLCIFECFTLLNAKVTIFFVSIAKYFALLLIQSSSSVDSVVILFPTYLQLCQSYLYFHPEVIVRINFHLKACVDCHYFAFLHLKFCFKTSQIHSCQFCTRVAVTFPVSARWLSNFWSLSLDPRQVFVKQSVS